MEVRNNISWILKAIMKQIPVVSNLQVWNTLHQGNTFQTRRMYEGLTTTFQEVSWRKRFYANAVRPRALFTLWMTCHEGLATNVKLVRFGMITDYN